VAEDTETFEELLKRFTKEVHQEKVPDYGLVEFEKVCPQNGWSMNEIWKYAYIKPPPGYFIMEDSGPCRTAYDYGEPAGYPTKSDQHSTLPGDWTMTEIGDRDRGHRQLHAST